MPRRLVLLALASTLACAALETRPEWVLKGYDPHADPVGARLSAVGKAGDDTSKPPMDSMTRHTAAETAARKELLKRIAEMVPSQCRQQITATVMTSPITDHWIAMDEMEYALAEISQGTLWELCPAMMERDVGK